MWCHFQPIGAQACSSTRARARSVCSPSSIYPEDLGIFIVMNRVLLPVAFQTETSCFYLQIECVQSVSCDSPIILEVFCKQTRLQHPTWSSVAVVNKMYYSERLVQCSTFAYWYHIYNKTALRSALHPKPLRCIYVSMMSFVFISLEHYIYFICEAAAAEKPSRNTVLIMCNLCANAFLY